MRLPCGNRRLPRRKGCGKGRRQYQSSRRQRQYGESAPGIDRAKTDRAGEEGEIGDAAVEAHDGATSCRIERGQPHDQHVQSDMVGKPPEEDDRQQGGIGEAYRRNRSIDTGKSDEDQRQQPISPAGARSMSLSPPQP